MTAENSFLHVDQRIEGYALQQLAEILEGIFKIQQGEGCCCPSCTKVAVSEANSLMWWCYGPYLEDSSLEKLYFYIDPHGQIKQGVSSPPLQLDHIDTEGTRFFFGDDPFAPAA